MSSRRFALILTLLALPSLAACGSADSPPGPPPPSTAALKAIVAESPADKEQLARSIDRLFDAEAVGETRALLVLHGGRTVVQRHGEGYGPETRFIGWSMAKCVTGLMIGLLASDGRLRLDESAPVPAWARPGDPRGKITLRQLLQMRSGLRHTENADPVYEADPARMLFLEGRDDMARYAEAQPLESEPGARHEYSSATSVILSDIATRVLTRSKDPKWRQQAVATFLRTRLFDPAGMDSMVPEFDAAGTFIGSSMLHGTARDWGKLGEFLRQGGSVRGAQIIPRRWVEFMRSPSPANPGFGAHLWLNRRYPDGSAQLFPESGPKSAVACIGHLGQYVIASPEQKLTVVRLGRTPEEKREELRPRLGELVALFPAG
ncbi:MAG: serine hydrolase [Alphaproteobacteria bacterium]|nr:serine hydrolase [Alphaproteobacteria bacterium]